MEVAFSENVWGKNQEFNFAKITLNISRYPGGDYHVGSQSTGQERGSGLETEIGNIYFHAHHKFLTGPT